MKIFLSYSAEDKALAGEIKSSLEDQFGVEAFLAHEDLEPASEWQEAILAELEACHVFVPILTTNFNSSAWTEQETGFAVARNIPIIPINAGAVPRGFIAKYQALKLHSNIRHSCSEIGKVVISKPEIRQEFLDAVIRNFGESWSFDRAGEMSRLINKFRPLYTTQQKNEIIRLAAENGQIYDCFDARRTLANFIDEFKDELEPLLIETYKSKVRA